MSTAICKRCGKSEVSTRAGSLTSFFFQHNFCQCKALTRADTKQKNSHNSVCKNCGKSRPEKKRAGSFTSYLFQDLRCNCPGTKDPKPKDQISTVSDSKSTAETFARTRIETRSPTVKRAALRRQFSTNRLNSSTDLDLGLSLDESIKETVFQPGDIIGNVFRVENQIGLGGMGVVYRAEHTALHRQFALKVLAPSLVNKQNWLRFQAEAKTIASLNHRTFVKVYDLGIHAKTVPFYSMDYLEGRTLETIVIEDGPVHLEQALEIFLEVLDGLAYAHRNSIIHRDLKPANIMLCTTGSIKVLDFGISKFVGADASKKQSLTAAGDIFGSPFYMSPEQCSGEIVDARSDIYSIGCTLFEVLTGFVPYEGRNSVETTLMHQEQEPPRLCDALPELDYPPSVDLVIRKCLAKEPEDRYQSAKELAIDLTRIKEGKDLRAYNDSYFHTNTKTSAPNKATISFAAGGAMLVGATALLVQTDVLKIKELNDLKHTSGHIEKLDATKQPEVLRQTEAKKREVSRKALNALEQHAFSTTNTSNTIANIELIDNFTLHGSNLSDRKILQIKEYIKNQTEPYSTVKTIGGKKLCVFNFPSKFSVGTLGFTKPGTTDFVQASAQGTVVTIYGHHSHLIAEDEMQCFPELLKYFRPNELDHVKLIDSDRPPAIFLSELAKQKNLKGVELRGTKLSDADIPLLEKLHLLKSLDVGNTAITGSALAKFKLLPQLNSLQASMLSDATPVLKILVQSNNITELNLSNVKLTAEDYTLISRLTNLRLLSLKESAITDADLLKLTTLKNLETLYIERCGNLTEATVEILKRFRGLTRLKPPDHIEEFFTDEILRQYFPRLRFN